MVCRLEWFEITVIFLIVRTQPGKNKIGLNEKHYRWEIPAWWKDRESCSLPFFPSKSLLTSSVKDC